MGVKIKIEDVLWLSHFKPGLPTEATGPGECPESRRNLLIVGVCLAVESWLTGRTVATPVVAVLIIALLYQRDRYRWEEGLKSAALEAEARLDLKYLHTFPATAAESADWVNSFMTEMFPKFLGPLASSKLVPLLTRLIEEKAPPQIKFDIQDWDFGHSPPMIQKVRAYNDHTGKLKYIDADFTLSTEGMHVMAECKLPALGTVSVTIDKAWAKGVFRLMPKLDERLLFMAFKEPPEFDYRVSVKSVVANLKLGDGKLAFIRDIIRNVIDQEITEPRRKCAGLEIYPLKMKVAGGTAAIQVNEVGNLPLPRGFNRVMVELSISEPFMGAINRHTQVVAEGESGMPGFQWVENNNFEMGFNGGEKMIKIKVFARQGEKKRRLLGMSLLHVKYLGDGSTAFFALSDDGDQLCKRWSKGQPAWEVLLPLEMPRRAAQRADAAAAQGKKMPGAPGGVDMSLHSDAWTDSGRDGWSPMMAATDSASHPRGVMAYYPVMDSLESGVTEREGSDHRAAVLRTLRQTASHREADSPSVRKSFFSRFQGSNLTDANASFGRSNHKHDDPYSRSRGTAMKNHYFPAHAESVPWVRLAVSMKSWVPKVSKPPEQEIPQYRSPGPHTIILQVVEARDLTPMDNNGTSDPYVKFRYNSKEHRTAIRKKQLNPVWMQSFKFKEEKLPHMRRLRLQVFDHDVRTKDEGMGTAVLNLDTLAENEVHDEWLELYGTETGMLRIQVVVVPGYPGNPAVLRVWQRWLGFCRSSPGEETGTKGTGAGSQTTEDAAYASPPEVLHLTVLHGRNLIACDRNGTSDPYVVLRYGSEEKVKSQVCTRTLNPTWNFTVAYRYARGAALQVNVLDRDRFSRDDPMGQVRILDTELERNNFRLAKWVRLEGVAQGEIYLEVVPRVLRELPKGLVQELMQPCRTLPPQGTAEREQRPSDGGGTDATPRPPAGGGAPSPPPQPRPIDSLMSSFLYRMRTSFRKMAGDNRRTDGLTVDDSVLLARPPEPAMELKRSRSISTSGPRRPTAITFAPQESPFMGDKAVPPAHPDAEGVSSVPVLLSSRSLSAPGGEDAAGVAHDGLPPKDRLPTHEEHDVVLDDDDDTTNMMGRTSLHSQPRSSRADSDPAHSRPSELGERPSGGHATGPHSRPRSASAISGQHGPGGIGDEDRAFGSMFVSSAEVASFGEPEQPSRQKSGIPAIHGEFGQGHSRWLGRREAPCAKSPVGSREKSSRGLSAGRDDRTPRRPLRTWFCLMPRFHPTPEVKVKALQQRIQRAGSSQDESVDSLVSART